MAAAKVAGFGKKKNGGGMGGNISELLCAECIHNDMRLLLFRFSFLSPNRGGNGNGGCHAKRADRWCRALPPRVESSPMPPPHMCWVQDCIVAGWSQM